ncbi:MAG: hypothetical protein KF805_03740 [Phycisphaeraceae bacterium]|nr:hypothetical protein [Phycisphaeraceae bacterium]
MNRFFLGFAVSASILSGATASTMLEPPAPAPTSAPSPAPEVAQNLPDAKSIMDTYLAAIGGTDRLKQIKSRKVTLNMEVPAMGMKGHVQIYQMPPAMAYSETEIAQIGKIQQGSDGETVWESNVMMGTRILTGSEREAFLRGMRFNADYDYEDTFKSLKTTGVENVSGKPAYVVELENKDGTKETRLFDKETGLMVGMRTVTMSQMGEIKSETVFSDYRDVSGVKIPFKFVVKAMQNEMVTTIEKAELDVPIPAERFDLPDDVKALLAKQKTESTSPTTESPNTPPDEKK